jgi:hypothetical protein
MAVAELRGDGRGGVGSAEGEIWIGWGGEALRQRAGRGRGGWRFGRWRQRGSWRRLWWCRRQCGVSFLADGGGAPAVFPHRLVSLFPALRSDS